MKYCCYNCSASPCIVEAPDGGEAKPFMCPWAKVEHFANWQLKEEVENLTEPVITK